jgi:hypothetical protein
VEREKGEGRREKREERRNVKEAHTLFSSAPTNPRNQIYPNFRYVPHKLLNFCTGVRPRAPSAARNFQK